MGELEHIMANLIQDNKHLEERLDSHGARLYTLGNLDIPQQVSKAVDGIVTNAVDWAIQAPLRNRFRDLPEADMKEILHQRMWETNSYKSQEDHMMLYEALKKSMNRDHTDKLLKDLAQARPSGTSGSPGASRSSQVPPLPPSTNQKGQSHGLTAPSFSKTPASTEYTAWTTTDTRLRQFILSIPEDLHMDDDMSLDAQAQSSDDEDIRNAYITKVNLQQDWGKPLEEDIPATPEPAWSIPSSDLPVSKEVDGIVTNAVDWAIQALLRNRFRDLPEADMKEILHQRMWETNSYKSQEDHMMLYEALKKSMNRDHTDKLLKDLAQARPSGTSGSPGASRSSQVPPLPPSTNQKGQSHGLTAPSFSKTPASTEYTAWTTTDTRLRQFILSIPEDLHMDDDMSLDAQAQSSDDEDIRNAYITKVNLQQDWGKPLEEDIPATPEPAWSIPSSDLPVLTKNWASALASTYTPPPEDSLLAHNVSKPLPLGGLPSHVIIRSDFFFNKDFEYLRYSSKGSRLALSISKMKAAYYPDVGLEQMVPDKMRIEEVCKYDIAAMGKYGVQMIMRFNKIQKFSDDTLHQIDEALDYQVKEFKVNRMNLGLNTRFWTRKDVDRSKEFMFAIQKWLKARRIFRNLESFVGGRVREGDHKLLQ
nr:hypothetical protein [Tanacetum cinerariifolium]